MADLTRGYTREELRALRDKILSGAESDALELTPQCALTLLSMAERAVSSKTLELVADGIRTIRTDPIRAGKIAEELAVSAARDLRPAAEALAKGTK